ncbi:ATP-dependent nuclease [Shewanella xiamenensis]|uniref:ATP-dependent nuclease n=1 Tax=Shewanella xiamenensis TaxID=332186 RepID=UPI001F06B46C|nr:AAA family ATPase [Shewanella xiamenensis]UML94262.1 ATP-binding protein [Shewanella xiamenensis]
MVEQITSTSQAMIRQITITNFRSIRKETISSEEITTLVGRNDAGKSNLLRALNLFFNGKTDADTNYNFESDFNINAIVHKQKAKEVKVELVLKLPRSYRKPSSPDTVYWSKVWRAEGFHAEEQKLCELKDGRIISKSDFPARSKIPYLLKCINYIYIPAIKDANFFRDLQGQLYDVLAAASGQGLHTSAKSFEAEINEHISELMGEIDSTFANSNNEVKLPQNLRNIFGALEFNADNIPLSRRGDGIKIRHIPMMLSFIALKQQSIGTRVAIRPQIWGFEEPENNVEFSTCFELNNQLVEAAKKYTQIFITTHSPAIYSLSFKDALPSGIKSVSYYVDKQGVDTKIRSCSEDELHGNIGFLNLVTPLIEEKRKIWTEQEAKYKATLDSLSSQLSLSSKPRIFLEGLSDKAIINRMLEYFGKNNEVYIDTSDEDHNNANSASDRAKAFHLLQKHAKEKIQGLLLLDDDEAGKSASRNFTDFFAGQTSMVKAITYPPSSAPKTLIRKGYTWKVELEHLYPEPIWQYALQQDWIEFIANEEQKFTDSKRRELFNQGISPLTYKSDLTQYQRLIVDYSFTHDGKRRVSQHIEKMTDNELESYGLVSAFTPVIELIIKELKLKTAN